MHAQDEHDPGLIRLMRATTCDVAHQCGVSRTGVMFILYLEIAVCTSISWSIKLTALELTPPRGSEFVGLPLILSFRPAHLRNDWQVTLGRQ